MKNAKNKNYYLSLDIGTNSVGYAATDENYNLLKFHGEPVWGATVFDAASLNTDRRTFRTARRRLDRRQQRIDMLQELFAKEIGHIDPRFFIRMEESTLYPEDKADKYTLFNDKNFTDKEYHDKYHTIHHLIDELMKSSEPHDVRLVYLACAWLVAHRGHFLLNFNVETAKDITDFGKTYDEFLNYFENNGGLPWNKNVDKDKLAEILKKEATPKQKYKELCKLICNDKESPTDSEDTEETPFKKEGILKLLAGDKCTPSDLFYEENSNELETEISLKSDEEAEFNEGDNIITALRKLYYWAPLTKILNGKNSISKAKTEIYDQHKKDLAFLKHIVKTYIPEQYDEVFRRTNNDNYAAYSHHTDEPHEAKWHKDKEKFSKFILEIIKEIEPNEADKAQFEDMKQRLGTRKFMPKQKDGDNCTIPQQLYFLELKEILKNASEYLPFLNETDKDGISTKSKIETIFSFRIPYFVGPLNGNSDNAWFQRNDNMEKEKIYPWNFNKIVDLEASERAFIDKMRNKCTYLPWERVLPKDSLAYHRFEVLNEINNLRINGEKISVELKQEIYNEVFMKHSNVTRKKIEDFLIGKTLLERDNRSALTGIDITIKSDLMPQHAFKRLMDSQILTENEVEKIIKRSTYAEDKSRLSKWLEKEFSKINDEDRKYICNIKIKDFGRLSRKFLCELQGINKETEEPCTILRALWETNYNLHEIVESDKFTFKKEIKKLRDEHYSEKKPTLEDMLDDMYISNAVKRPIYRALDIVSDVTKVFGKPTKIFIETTRGGTKEEKEKEKRKKCRRTQILESYEICREEVKNLREEVDRLRQQERIEHLSQQLEQKSDNELQSDKLFFYFMQLGRCMYTNKEINIDDPTFEQYDIDHIYPQSYVKDDSIDNRVLVESRINKDVKKNIYPVSAEIRNKMTPIWERLKKSNLISAEKFNRLTRSTPFTEDEKLGFIKRQLVVTAQSVKAIKTLLENEKKFSGTEIVCCKASLVSEFRREFKLLKSRLFNDLHHAVDAYLNIAAGNVYSTKFTKNFNVNSEYSVKIETLFNPKKPFEYNGKEIWSQEMLAKVKETAVQNTAHFTQFAFFRKGKLFEQQLYPPKEKGLVPRKKNLPTEKYGGYDGVSTSYLLLVGFNIGKKSEVMFYPVPLILAEKFEKENGFAEEYILSTLRAQKSNKIQKIEILLNGRKIKIGSTLSLDGFRVAIANASFKDGRMSCYPTTQFAHSIKTATYIKKLEKLHENTQPNSTHIYDPKRDMVTAEENIKLYDIYISKLESTIYNKRPGLKNKKKPEESIVPSLKNKRSTFATLPPLNQCRVLLQIHSLFCRSSSDGINLKLLDSDLAKSTGKARLSLSLSNWDDYKDVRIIDSSASGLWEKKSENLLELL